MEVAFQSLSFKTQFGVQTWYVPFQTLFVKNENLAHALSP